MTGVRFYLEHDTLRDKRKGNHNGNVFAAFVCNGVTRGGGYEGMGAVNFDANSPVSSTSCDGGYLRMCKRISEARAREIHPNLFVALDA